MKILIEKAVIEQALEALEQWKEHDAWHKRNDWNDEDESAITALREALAEQAEQEPVCIDWDTKTDEPIMGYAAPVRTKDLTDDEINDVMEPNMSLFDFARAVIVADRKKNK